MTAVMAGAVGLLAAVAIATASLGGLVIYTTRRPREPEAAPSRATR